MPGEIQIPTMLSGVITRLENADICMDDATHHIHTHEGAKRLKGRNPQATAALESVANRRVKVSVMCYPVFGPECLHYSAYAVSNTEVVVGLMGGDYWPWATLNLKSR